MSTYCVYTKRARSRAPSMKGVRKHGCFRSAKRALDAADRLRNAGHAWVKIAGPRWRG